eukprot:scaffold3181_cov389-Prasinococcus_capsulatus_cf.AAC.10
MGVGLRAGAPQEASGSLALRQPAGTRVSSLGRHRRGAEREEDRGVRREEDIISDNNLEGNITNLDTRIVALQSYDLRGPAWLPIGGRTAPGDVSETSAGPSGPVGRPAGAHTNPHVFEPTVGGGQYICTAPAGGSR